MRYGSCDGSTSWYRDEDGDGFGDPSASQQACEAPSGFVEDATDCDDTDAEVHPGATELIGDGRDGDCDGQEQCFLDADGDGYSAGLVASEDLDCEDSGESAVESAEDCDDADPEVHPEAQEGVGDGVDGDCDGAELCYVDEDGDGYSAGATVTSQDLDCEDEGELDGGASLDDCDDQDAAFHPGAPEDDCTDPNDYDCDGEVAYQDLDGDGFAACEDCDDQDALAHPGADETCGNGVDEDCDGLDAACEEGEAQPGDPGCGGCASSGRSGAPALVLLGLLALARRRP